MSASPGVARAFAWAALRLLALFALVFYGIDAWTAGRSLRVPLHLAAELAIPYWPAAFPLYFSVLAVPFLMLPLAGSADAVRRWERDMALAITFAGLCFLLVPAQLAYVPEPAGAWAGWATLATWVAGRHNLLPSLHVALSLLTMLHAGPAATPRVRMALAGWFGLLVASVLVTHQHHIADVVAGSALALALHARSRRALRQTSDCIK